MARSLSKWESNFPPEHEYCLLNKQCRFPCFVIPRSKIVNSSDYFPWLNLSHPGVGRVFTKHFIFGPNYNCGFEDQVSTSFPQRILLSFSCSVQPHKSIIDHRDENLKIHCSLPKAPLINFHVQLSRLNYARPDSKCVLYVEVCTEQTAVCHLVSVLGLHSL